MRILLVEDDAAIAEALHKVLSNEHYAIDVASDGDSGWQMVSASHYDLVILDIVLPKLDGLTFCKRLREFSYGMPVLLVTALDSSDKKIAGLNAGADDYITKPFEVEELLARVRALLRRAKTSVLLSLDWGDLRLETNSREVTYRQTSLNLTPKEYALLELFLRNSSQVFSRRAILDSLWSYSEAPGEETVTSHIKGLRRKLSQAGASADFIETIYGVGYRLNPLTSSESSNNARDEETEAAATQDVEQVEKQARQQKTKAMLATLWTSVQFQQIERLDLLKEMLQRFQSGQTDDALRQAGYRAAHGLTGALGVFGMRSGSHTAREVQELLAGKAVVSAEMCDRLIPLIESLDRDINHAIQDSEPVRKECELPLVVLIDPQLDLTSVLVKALWEKGLAVKISPDIKALQRLANILQCVQSQPPADTSSAKRTFPDVVLLDFSLSEASSDQIKMLSALTRPIPDLMLMICSSDGSLANRIKAAQLGDYPFLYTPKVAAVVEGIVLLRSHVQKHAHKILIVDDDAQALSALQLRMEGQGFEVVTLNDPLNFWDTLQTTAPDLLLLDILMPEFSGIELCQAVRQSPAWNHLPIVFFTAYSDRHLQQSAFRVGANDFVEKSLPHSELQSHLRDHIRRSHLQQAIAAIAHSTP